jgi:predicted hydrocarbon binding protein
VTFNMEYQFDEKNGIIKDRVTGDRCIIITRARMEQILTRISDLFQSGAQVIIKEACKAAGQRYVAEVPAETKADPVLFLKTAVKRFTDAGLGKIEILEVKPEKGELKFRIWNNFFAEIHNEEPTYCNCVEAFVSGVYEGIVFRTPKIEKVKCVGKGDPYCEWHLAP